MNKFCSSCNTEKEYSFFSFRKASKDGLTASCKICISERKKSLTSTAAYNKAYREKNKDAEVERIRSWRTQNKEAINEYKKKYRKEFPLLHSILDSHKRASRLQRVPPWLNKEDKENIKVFYKKAKELSEYHKCLYQIDHIVPLKGKDVSGLHVPWNLQILTAEENNRKNNKYEDLSPQA